MAHVQLDRVTVVLSTHQDGQRVDVHALDEASLVVRSGEVMGVIGPTGCGKTTLLRAVAGLVPLAGGRVLIDGRDQAGVPPKDRGLGMVFQNYALYPHYSVWNNLAFYFRLRRREAEVPAKVKEAAEILGVNFNLLLGRRPANLSLGQRQQVAVARCLVRDPNIFLMDEPFANLDPPTRSRARLQTRRLLQRFRVTTLYVTHDQQEAAGLCDRIAVMDVGQIWQVDTYRHLLTWPRNLRVARFVGEPGTQFVDGAMLDGHFVCPAFSVPLLPNLLVRTVVGQALVAGVRPSALRPADPVEPGALPGRITWIEPLPLRRLQRVSCQVGAYQLTVELPDDRPLRVDDPLALRIDPAQVHVFDAASGANLALGRS